VHENKSRMGDSGKGWSKPKGLLKKRYSWLHC
jgi:hypothetical protein